MSICTRRGDRGETDLLYSRRVPKSDFKINCIGCIDEATSALGLVRVLADANFQEEIAHIQQDFVAIMGELAVEEIDYERYQKDKHDSISAQSIEKLDKRIEELEASLPKVTDWVIPGAKGSEISARLDWARSIVRRAERELVDLAEVQNALNPDLLIYLNRLGDLLWLYARKEEE